MNDPTSGTSWQTRYCQAQTHANWRMGNVQRAKRIDDHDGSRLLSVKLKQHWLVTLSEVKKDFFILVDRYSHNMNAVQHSTALRVRH